MNVSEFTEEWNIERDLTKSKMQKRLPGIV